MTTSPDSGTAIAASLVPSAPSPHSDASDARPAKPQSQNDYMAVAATRRFRAAQRRRVLNGARLGLAIIAGVALVNCAMLLAIHRDAAGIVLPTNGALIGVACAGHVVLRERGRQSASAVVFIAASSVAAGAILLALIRPELTLLAAGYLLLTPVAVAMIIPWRTGIHTVWLVVVSGGALVFTLGAPETGLQPAQRLDLVVLILAAAAVSQSGHVLSLRVRVESYLQLERINHLRSAEADNLKAVERLNRALAIAARTDQLTSLGNRLRLVEDLRTMRGRIDRNDERYAVFMADLDRFKKVNDRRGHLAGDEVLSAVSAALLGPLRIDDGAYRYGGEEFVALVQIRSDSEALLIAERLRAAVEGLAISHPDNLPFNRVTVSIGATVIGRGDLVDSPGAWLGRADAALYKAKASGRNRCEFIPSPHLADLTRLMVGLGGSSADGPRGARGRGRRLRRAATRSRSVRRG